MTQMESDRFTNVMAKEYGNTRAEIVERRGNSAMLLVMWTL